MKTFVVLSTGPYGDIVQIFNAATTEQAWRFASTCNHVWPYYKVIEIDTTKEGLVFDGTDED